MLKEKVRICQSNIDNDCVQVKEVNINELVIVLPFEGYTIKLSTPLFDIEASSPAEITLIAITSNEFIVEMVTAEFALTTMVSSLVLEVFNPQGDSIIRIVAPPEL